MSLREKLDEIRRGAVERIPAENREIIRQATEELRSSGILDRVLKVGDEAPAFELPNVRGEAVGSAGLLERGPLVVTFYRGLW